MQTTQKYDILCAGEYLVDGISADFAASISFDQKYQMIPGGSPANLCMNMARLGRNCRLAATVGQDDMGKLLIGKIAALGIHTGSIKSVKAPTTLILVTRSKEVANFEAYRSADYLIGADQMPEELLANARIFHSTCFSWSKDPARTSILQAARQSFAAGNQLSVDLNYAEKIWPDRETAQSITRAYCAMKPLVKVSEVDWERLYEKPLTDPAEAARHFLALGAKMVCVTLGEKGCLVARAAEQVFIPSRPVAVLDTTGAGDAFWSGFLNAWLEGGDAETCGLAGRKMAELKLGHFGPLPNRVVL